MDCVNTIRSTRVNCNNFLILLIVLLHSAHNISHLMSVSKISKETENKVHEIDTARETKTLCLERLVSLLKYSKNINQQK